MYSIFQDLSLRSIETGFLGFETRLKFIKFGHWSPWFQVTLYFKSIEFPLLNVTLNSLYLRIIKKKWNILFFFSKSIIFNYGLSVQVTWEVEKLRSRDDGRKWPESNTFQNKIITISYSLLHREGSGTVVNLTYHSNKWRASRNYVYIPFHVFLFKSILTSLACDYFNIPGMWLF